MADDIIDVPILGRLGIRRAMLTMAGVPLVFGVVVLSLAVRAMGDEARAATEQATRVRDIGALNAYISAARVEAIAAGGSTRLVDPDLDDISMLFEVVLERQRSVVDDELAELTPRLGSLPDDVRVGIEELNGELAELRSLEQIGGSAEVQAQSATTTESARTALRLVQRWALSGQGPSLAGIVAIGDAHLAFDEEGEAVARILAQLPTADRDRIDQLDRLPQLMAITDTELTEVSRALPPELVSDFESVLASPGWEAWLTAREVIAGIEATEPPLSATDRLELTQSAGSFTFVLALRSAMLADAIADDADAEAALVRELQRMLVVAGMAMAALLSALVWAVYLGLTSRISRMSVVAERISAGELDSDPLGIAGRDELAKLGSAMDEMSVTLRTAQAQIEALAEGAGEALDAPLPGSVGRAMRQAIRRLSVTTGQLRHRAAHDALTGLLDRGGLATSLDEILVDGEALAVVVLDLDGFKAINDGLGHAAGDTVLCAVAGRLRHSVQGSDLVARVGGDEFALVLRGLFDPTDVEAVTERLRAIVGQPIEVVDRVVTVGASIGWTVTDAAEPFEVALQRADEAMYEAKRTGKGTTSRGSLRLH